MIRPGHRPGGSFWRLAPRLALRELRGHPGALWLLFVCICLGVLAMAGVNSLAQSIHRGLAAEGQTMLGGDIDARLTGRAPSPDELDALNTVATQTSASIRMRAMLRVDAGSDHGAGTLVELKAVDQNWPLYGEARTTDGGGNDAVQQALQQGAVIARALAEQLNLQAGDRIRLGDANLTISAILQHEPDQAGIGFAFGPTVLIAREQLPATHLLQPGSLFHWHQRLRLPAGADPLHHIRQLQHQFPDSDWQLVDHGNSAPGLRRFIDMLSQFLTLVSLTALVIAGVGVGNGVHSQLVARRHHIATLKALGATTALVRMVYLLVILAVALLAAVAGALLGALVPVLAGTVLGAALPVPAAIGVYPSALIPAMITGLLVAMLFALPPLARASALSPAQIYRSDNRPPRQPSARWPLILLQILLAAAILLLTLWQASDRRLVGLFLAGAVAALLLLYVAGMVAEFLAARWPRPRRMIGRLALSALHRPGNFTRQLVVALGLGIGLFAMLAYVETSLHANLDSNIPDRAPAFFLLDLPQHDLDRFHQLLPDGSDVQLVPSLRGPVTAVNDVPSAELRDVPAASYVLNGDRGLTFASDVPDGNRLVAGHWWPADYAGPPLVSMEIEQAQLLGLGVGDRLTVSVLGVPITAEIASLREVDWNSYGFNFVLVFDPGSLAGAPFTYMATVTPPDDALATFPALIGQEFPSVSIVRVDDVLDRVSAIITQMSIAIRAAAVMTILAGTAVLVGALAARTRLRRRDNVILKLLGATRLQLMAAAGLEYALLALGVALVAMLAGGLAAWAIITHILDLAWQPDWPMVLLVVLAGSLITFLLGMISAWNALGIRIASTLRQI